VQAGLMVPVMHVKLLFIMKLEDLALSDWYMALQHIASEMNDLQVIAKKSKQFHSHNMQMIVVDIHLT
jgi:hypothetical protein